MPGLLQVWSIEPSLRDSTERCSASKLDVAMYRATLQERAVAGWGHTDMDSTKRLLKLLFTAFSLADCTTNLYDERTTNAALRLSTWLSSSSLASVNRLAWSGSTVQSVDTWITQAHVLCGAKVTASAIRTRPGRRHVRTWTNSTNVQKPHHTFVLWLC